MNNIYIDVSSFSKGIEKLKSVKSELANRVDEVLDANAEDIATKAKQLAPVDIGGMRAQISADNSKLLEKRIIVNAVYAAYVEFGTGKYAAEYVGSLPASWREYAAQFKGSTGKQGLLEKIQEWVKRKGIAQDYKSVGYLIYRSILINGIHPHPFLFPAYQQQKPAIIADIENIIKSLPNE